MKIHQCFANTLPAQKESLAYAIKESVNILGEKTNRILDYLESLPNGVSVCHGDFHPDNILISNKDFIAIDWTNAYYGNPLGDVARTYLMISSPYIPSGISKIMVLCSKIVKRLINSAYLKEYLRLRKVKFEDMDAWILPVAAARICENIPEEKKWLLDIINNRFKHLKPIKT